MGNYWLGMCTFTLVKLDRRRYRNHITIFDYRQGNDFICKKTKGVTILHVNRFLKLNFLLVACIPVFAGIVSAQNARIDALGGNFCIDDISSIQWNPSASVYYNDMVQGTAYQDGSFGSVIGIKSLGKYFSLGISANTPADLQSSFYTDAKSFLDSTIDTMSVLPEQLPPYPHLITAVKLPFMIIGAEFFRERTRRSLTFTEESVTHTVHKEVANTGMNLNASIMIGKLGIYPFFKFAVPVMSGEIITGSVDSTVHSTTSLNRTIKCGMELGISPHRFTFTLGGLIFSENYVFESDQLLNERNSKNFVTAIDLYGGVTTYPKENVLLSIVYNFNHAQYTATDETKINSALQNSNDIWIEDNHFTVASCELNHDIPSWGISIILRTGISWYVSTVSLNSEYSEENYTYKENTKYPGDVSQVVPALGIGFQKGMISFDIASKLAGWSGIASGMPVVTGTLTLDFSEAVHK